MAAGSFAGSIGEQNDHGSNGAITLKIGGIVNAAVDILVLPVVGIDVADARQELEGSRSAGAAVGAQAVDRIPVAEGPELVEGSIAAGGRVETLSRKDLREAAVVRAASLEDVEAASADS